MNKIFLFLILIFLYINAESQGLEISGSIVDSISKVNLAYGNVVLKNKKDSIIAYLLTNDKGEFKFKNISFKNDLYIQTIYFGYYNKKIDIPIYSKSINLGEICLMQNVTQLKEVHIVGTIKNVEQKFDRKVFNINENKTTSARSILDLLRTLPGVVVSEDGSVRYKGAPANIYVDDQPSNFIYPKVEMIPVANVDKIELIDGSSRGGGSGTGGIINIKMKKILSDGLSGMLSLTENSIEFKRTDQFNGFANVNYKFKKIIIFNNFDDGYLYNYNNKLADGIFKYNKDIYKIKSEVNNSYTEKTFDNVFGVRIFPSTKTKITITSSYDYYKQVYNSIHKQEQNYSLTGKKFDDYSANNNGTATNPYKGLHIFFTHIIDTTGKEMHGGITLQNVKDNQDDFTTNHYSYLSSLAIDSMFHISNKMRNINNTLFYNFYYNNPINSKTRWNLFFKGFYNLKKLTDEKFQLNNLDFLPFNKITNYKNSQNQLSFHLGTILKKWKFDGGLSLQYNKFLIDYTRFNIDNQDTLLIVDKDFISLLPSATTSYAIDSIQELKITYARTMEVPDNLCDFIDKQNPRNWSSGNSNLKSVKYNNLYFGYSLNKDSWNFSAEAFYSLTNNEVSDIQYPYSEVIILTMPENIAKKNSLGIDLSSWISLKEKYDFNIATSLYHSSIDASSLKEKLDQMGLNETNLKTKDYGYNIKFSSDIKFNSKTSGMFYVNYFSREITFEGYSYGYFNSSLNITRKFFSKKLFLTIGVNNLLDDIAKHGEYSNYLGMKKTTTEISCSFKRTYFFTLLYKFRQGDRGTKDIK